MTKLITLRDDQVPTHLVVIRMGSTTLSDSALSQACERAYLEREERLIWPP